MPEPTAPVLRDVLDDGAVVSVEGVARAADGQLEAPLSKTPCLYWEVREGLHAAPLSRAEGARFWLEVGGERVLVDLREAALDILAARRRQAMAVADADVQDVSARLRALKDQRRQTSGARLKELNAEYRQLKKLATLLCAIRAHARGNVHVGGNLEGQERYIRERGPKLGLHGKGMRSLLMTVERFEALIGEGQELRVTGLCERAAAPLHDPLAGQGGGSRQAPQCWHLRATGSRPLQVRGVGAMAPPPRQADGHGARTPQQVGQARRGRRGRPLGYVAVVVALLLAALLWWFGGV